jgi:hypothetical protein
MKKLVFALEIFAVITAFPLYVIIELNHLATPSTLSEASKEVIQTQELPGSMAISNATLVLETSFPAFISPNNTFVETFNHIENIKNENQ